MHKFGVEKLEVLTRILSLLDQQKKQQKDLADFLGINKNNITDWKSGKSKSYNKYLYQIAAYLNTTPEYLKGETDIISNSEPEKEQKKSPSEVGEDQILKGDLAKIFLGLLPEQQEQAKKYLLYLLDTQEKTSQDNP